MLLVTFPLIEGRAENVAFESQNERAFETDVMDAQHMTQDDAGHHEKNVSENQEDGSNKTEKRNVRSNEGEEGLKTDAKDTGSVKTEGFIQEELPINDARKRDGASYWITSNIREWLNSDKVKVEYTNPEPTYKNEAGFLNNFTQEERDAIAVTKRRVFLAGDDSRVKDGGSKSLLYVTDLGGNTKVYALVNHALRDFDVNWKEYNFVYTNDKVFLLSPHEIHFYVQQRGMSLQKKDRNGNYYQWWSTANLWNQNAEAPMYIHDTGHIFRVDSRSNAGIVPALHLKPNYVLSNGKKANELKIGEKVNFGKYQGKPIKWTVINKTPEGYPLLWSDEILTIKQFQSAGEKFYRYSESINFAHFDVDISDDLKIYNTKGDIKPPRIYVVNKKELDERKNENFVLYLKAEDESGIEKIILDDGTEVKSDSASVLIEENKIYHFYAVDKAGNYGGIMIPVNNLNPPAEVEVIPSHTNWTNKDVKISIEASNDYDDFYTDEDTLNTFGKHFYTYPNKISYANKRIRITGEVQLVKANRPLEDYSVGVALTYLARTPLKDGYIIGDNYPIEYVAKLSEIQDKPKKFDVIMTVGSNYFDSLRVGVRYNYPQVWGSNQYVVRFKNLKYELLDVEDFKIIKITLPDGEEVYDKRYIYTATKTGTYTFHVLDNRGKITTKSVDVKIDKIKPTLKIEPNTKEITNEDVVLSVRATDEGGSGIKRIRLPNGEYANKDNVQYTVKENGTYTFEVEDHAGNVTKESITINNIDKTLSMEQPVIESFGEIELTESIQTVATDIKPFIIKDWRENQNAWRLDVKAERLKTKDGGFVLPSGMIKLNGLSEVKRIKGVGSLPDVKLTSKKTIDTGRVTVAESDNSRGEFEFVFPNNALEITVDPSVVKAGEYKLNISWELVNAP